ncbi:MAG TPA: ABC transporter ATP-binding protein, partial [Candidatus Ozemobacteraceae bacterium]|nr:ABC transporter ATP-binding protein [Candidatus Ozemobacteraceae bacterium]
QNLYDRLSARQHLQFFAHLTDSPAARIAEVLALLGLDEYADTPTQRLSRGWRQRVLIARGLLHEPDVFFLDEPTSALDPHSALSIRHVINTLRKKGTTVFLTTHYMEEANSLCDRIAILHNGTIVAEDTPEVIRMRFGQPSMNVTIRNGQNEADTTITLPLNDSPAAEKLSALLAEGRVKKIHSQEATLEEAFLRLTGSSWQEPENIP